MEECSSGLYDNIQSILTRNAICPNKKINIGRDGTLSFTLTFGINMGRLNYLNMLSC